jgi:hypothetical protein
MCGSNKRKKSNFIPVEPWDISSDTPVNPAP